MLLVYACAALQQAVALGASKGPPPPTDLMKEHNWKPARDLREPGYYNIGPTGMIGFIPQGGKGDQIWVARVDKGSPADGLIERGNVLLGVSGERFRKGEFKIITIGNAIDEAEREENGGRITFTVWHDRNYSKRHAGIDMGAVSVEDLFEQVAKDKDSEL